MSVCIRDGLRRAWNGFLNLLFPTRVRCLLCGCEVDGALLCTDCASRIVINDGVKRCQLCSRPLIAEERYCPSCTTGDRLHFDRVVAACVYEGAVVTLIHRLKFGRQGEIAELFGELMRAAMVDLPEFDVIVSVPTARENLAVRGYNQAELLGKTLSSGVNVPIEDALLKKSGTQDQVGLSGRDRRTNVRDTIKVVSREKVKGRRVLVVDDIMTTGATLSECARVLKAAGATEVYGIVAAIVPTKVKNNTARQLDEL